MSKQRRSRYAVLLIAAFAAIAGLSASADAGTAAKSKLTVVNIRITPSGDWGTLDPLSSRAAGNSLGPIHGMYDTLVDVTAAGKVEPYLATGWKLGKGAIQFALRTDAVCSDGTKVTANVVAASIRAFFASSSPAKAPFGKGPFNVTVIGKNRITVGVAGGTTDLLIPFADPRTGIICPAGLSPSADYDSRSYGSGPYTLVSAAHGDGVQEALNPKWKWGPAGATAAKLPARLNWKVLTDETTAANALITGQLNIAQITGLDVPRLSANKSLFHAIGYSPWTSTFFLNHAEGHPTADPNVRAALTLLTDRAAYAQAAYAGAARPAASIVGKEAQCFDPKVAKLVSKPSKAKALALLAKAGYTRGAGGQLEKDGKPLTINLVGRSDLGQGPTLIAQEWGAAGINVELQAPAIAQYLVLWHASNFDALVFAPASPLPDININLQYYLGPTPPNGNNFGFTKNAKASTAAQKAITTPGMKKRCAYWATVQESLLKAHNYIPLVQAASNWYGSGGVSFAPATLYLDPTTIRVK